MLAREETFDGLLVCLEKTAAGPKGFFSRVSLGGIIPYRGFQLGAFDTIVGLNPWKYDTGMITSPPRLRRHRQPSFGRRYTHSCRESIRDSTRCLRISSPSCSSRQHPDQLFGVGALAHRGLLNSGVCAGKPLALLALHLSAREGCPGHCDTLTGGTLFIPDGSEKFPMVSTFGFSVAERCVLGNWSEGSTMPKKVMIPASVANS